MEVEIISKRENHLLKRLEVRFQTAHPKASTPNRNDIRQQLAKEFSAKKENVILDSVRSEYGRTRTVGYAKIYKSKEDAMRIERKPILIRMGLLAPEKVEKPKEKKVEEPPKPAKKEEAPAEKPAKKEEPPAKKEEVPAKKEERPKGEKKGEGEKAETKKPAKGGK